MVLRALRAVPDPKTPSTETTSSAFAAAKARWERASAERRELKDQYDGARAALQLAVSPPGAGDHPSPRLVELADSYLAGRPGATADVLRAELIALDDQLTRASRTYTLERTAWQEAVDVEARRLAEELRPAHKQACREMAKAVEALSAAVERERKVRARLLELGCAAALPDAGKEFGSLADFHWTLSIWNRRMLQARAFDA